MNTMQVTQHFKVNPRIILNSEKLAQLDESFLKIQSDNKRESVLIESFTGNNQTGHLLILPLFSKSKPKVKQAVLFSNLLYTYPAEAEKLISEGLMCSWELGYHVAFTLDSDSIYRNSMFRNIPRNNFQSFPFRNSLFFSELSWDGLKKVEHDLIFPVIENN